MAKFPNLGLSAPYVTLHDLCDEPETWDRKRRGWEPNLIMSLPVHCIERLTAKKSSLSCTPRNLRKKGRTE